MKSVLINICPQWVEKITTGKKKIELRKTAPTSHMIERPPQSWQYLEEI